MAATSRASTCAPSPCEELATSIKAQGVVQPIVVRPLEELSAGGAQRYEIIAGERRWRAAQLAGLAEIPAIIRHIPDEAAIAVALIENIQRENLNAVEEARALERLIAEFGLTHQQAADAVGRSRAGVSNLLRLLELAARGVRDARAAHAGDGPRARAAGADTAPPADRGGDPGGEEGPVGARHRGAGAPAAGTARQQRARATAAAADPNVEKLQQELAEKLGARVAIQHGRGGRGKLIVNYNSLDELDGILAHIQ